MGSSPPPWSGITFTKEEGRRGGGLATQSSAADRRHSLSSLLLFLLPFSGPKQSMKGPRGHCPKRKRGEGRDATYQCPDKNKSTYNPRKIRKKCARTLESPAKSKNFGKDFFYNQHLFEGGHVATLPPFSPTPGMRRWRKGGREEK